MLGVRCNAVRRQAGRPPSLALGPLQWWLRVFSALYSGRFGLCRDGLVGFFVRVKIWFSGAARAPSKESAQSDRGHMSFRRGEQIEATRGPTHNIFSVFFAFISCQLPIQMTFRAKILYVASNGGVTCLDLKQHCRYSPHVWVIWDRLLHPRHLVSVPIRRSPEWSLHNANID